MTAHSSISAADCAPFTPLLHLLVDGEGEGLGELGHHLEQCPSCREQADLLRVQKQLLEDLTGGDDHRVDHWTESLDAKIVEANRVEAARAVWSLLRRDAERERGERTGPRATDTEPVRAVAAQLAAWQDCAQVRRQLDSALGGDARALVRWVERWVEPPSPWLDALARTLNHPRQGRPPTSPRSAPVGDV